MALNDRDIVITPNKGQNDDPKIVFSGANASVSAQNITLRVYPDNAGTLSFEGSAGQLFSITNDLTGTLFSINDGSGIPSLEVNADGTVTIAEFSGNVGIGTGVPVTDFHVQGQTVITGRVGIGTANVVTLNSNILSVYGTAMVYGNIDLGNPTGGTSGLYFNDGTYQTTAFTGATTPSFGAAGTIQFAGAGNTFSGDTANLFWDDANNRLGLGTQSPAGTLDVRGGLGVTAASNFGGSLTVASLASNGAVSGTTGTFSTSLYSATFNTAGTATVASLVSNGAVSGTTGTFTGALYGASFNTAGTATVAAVVSNGAITGTTGTFTSIQNSGLVRAANIVSNTWIHATQNLTVASSNTSTTTATGALVVTGGAGIGGNVNAGGVAHTFNGSIGIRGNTNPWGAGFSSVIQLKAPSSSGSTVSLASIDVDDNLVLVRNAYFQDAVDWRHSSLGPATIYQQDTTGTHTWSVAPSQNAGNIVTFTPIMTVDATGMAASNVGSYGNMIAVGRIGVGTSSDQGFTNTAAFFGTVESYGNVKLVTPTGGTAGIYFADGSYQTTAAFPGATSSGIAGAVQFSTGTGTFNSDAANLFWDNANDRLGIGTTSPTNVLTVRSTLTPAWFNTVNSAVSSNNYEILVGNSVVHGATVGYVNNALVPYGYLSAGTTTRNIIIASNGRVGIGGATVPQNILDVNGAAVIGTAYAGARTASANGLLVQGSVGIGTFTATQPLDVRGNAYIDGTHNLFTGRVGIGTNTALGASANVLSIYGTAMVFGNIDLGNTAAGGAGVYFADGTFQNTAYVPTTYTTFTYTGNGSTTTYSTSPVTSSNINNTMVYINGVYQRKSTYGWSGTTVTFNVAPPNFSTIEIMVVQSINAPFGSVAGDISVNGNITISGGAIVASGSNTYVFNTVATGVYIGGNARDVQIGNAVSTTRINGTNASISTTTGGLVVAGGVGVGGNINVGGTRSLFTGSVGVGTSTPLGTNANVFSVYGTAMVYGNIDLGDPTGGTSGIYFGDGTYQTTAGGAPIYSTKTSNYTAVANDKLLCDTTAGTFTVTLPATPAFGATIIIYDKSNFSINPLTIGRNGSTIENLADDFSIDVGQTRTEFVYDGATWHLYVSIGPRGFQGNAAPTSASVAYSVALG